MVQGYFGMITVHKKSCTVFQYISSFFIATYCDINVTINRNTAIVIKFIVCCHSLRCRYSYTISTIRIIHFNIQAIGSS